jgi:hypothetical protein
MCFNNIRLEVKTRFSGIKMNEKITTSIVQIVAVSILKFFPAASVA